MSEKWHKHSARITISRVCVKAVKLSWLAKHTVAFYQFFASSFFPWCLEFCRRSLLSAVVTGGIGFSGCHPVLLTFLSKAGEAGGEIYVVWHSQKIGVWAPLAGIPSCPVPPQDRSSLQKHSRFSQKMTKPRPCKIVDLYHPLVSGCSEGKSHSLRRAWG